MQADDISLWGTDNPPGSPCDGTLPHETYCDGKMKSVAHPRLIVHKRPQPNGAAALVISGGGYFMIDVDKESAPTAKWLATLGVTAFELIYRLPKDIWGESADHWKSPPHFESSPVGWKAPPSVVPFQDGLQAMKVIRSLVGTAGSTIDPNRIAVVGYSAGGHLAGMLATGAAARLLGIANDQRPYFAALLYPILSMTSINDATESMKHLLPEDPVTKKPTANDQQRTACSVEQQVDDRTPPMFLAQSSDDPISSIKNTQLMFDALHSHKPPIPVEYHPFATGGHGWGYPPHGEPSKWPGLFETWAKSNGFLPTRDRP
jgi:acetyl esterase/lipase